MSLKPVTSKAESKKTFRMLNDRLSEGAAKYTRTVGWQGGNEKLQIFWHSRKKFWCHLDSNDDPNDASNRYWIIFGTEDPTQRDSVSIICEINPPFEGINRRCAGVFLKDDSGRMYLGHSGKIGGGRAGVGKETFSENYRGMPQLVRWPDGDETQIFVIGALDKHLPARIGEFVHEVARIKALATGSSQFDNDIFRPEFTGKKSYHTHQLIESECRHGLVINTLAGQLEKRGLQCANDQRDLFVKGADGRMVILFEAKTDVTTASLYSAIGQLMYYSSAKSANPKLVVVVPESPKQETEKILSKLGIHVLHYDWNEDVPVFPDLEKIVRS